MSVLGQPYRIFYLSRGVSGLTDVQAVVFKPDKSIAGIFPLIEAGGMFSGAYYYDYVSSTSDREGEHFSKVVSPSENEGVGVVDIVRFSLYKQGGGDATQSLSPNPLVAYIMSKSLGAVVLEAGQSLAKVADQNLQAVIDDEQALTAVVLDEMIEAEMSSTETIVVPRYC